MSQHKSLQGASGIVIKRNVLKRFERVDLLKKRGQWKAGDRVQGRARPSPTSEFNLLLPAGSTHCLPFFYPPCSTSLPS